ncbi:MAG: signal peptidase I [Planctomycetes bacterium]|nr:signal peptidase I [Planctomycetota bacterium]
MTSGERLSASLAKVLRDALPVAVVALVTFRLLQNHVADRYQVDSGSMQPTIHGTPVGGDVVLVDKTAAAAELRRHDIAVFEKPGRPREQIVKRVVAFGDEFVDFREGDLWLGQDQQRLQRDVKDPIRDRDLRIPWTRWPALAQGDRLLLRLPQPRADGRIDLPAAGDRLDDVRPLLTIASRRHRLERFDVELLAPGFHGTSQQIDSSYLDVHDRRGRESAQRIDDAGMDLELTTSATAVLLTFELCPDAWTFVWQPANGQAELCRNGEPVARQPLRAAADRPCRLEFGLLDNHLFLIVDGDAVWKHELPADARTADPGPTARPWPRTLLTIAVLGGAAELARLEVFHDIHYFRERIPGLPGASDWPRLVPPGHAFLLGDNTIDSVDSRSFGAVPMATFLGRPRSVLGPWPRHRWFRR